MKIDLHTHILPERWPDLRERYGYGGFPRIEHHAPCCARLMIDDRFFREIRSNCWDPVVRIEECDAAGVSVQALSNVPVMFSYWARPADAADLAKLLNDHIAGVVAQHSRRFVGLGTIPLQDPELAIRELERCVLPAGRGGLGLAGVQIGTHVNHQPGAHATQASGAQARYWNLNEPALFPVFEAAQELGAAVFVHPWDMLGQERMPKYWLPWLVGMPAETSLAICSMIFGGVFERLPRLRVCFSHGGGSFPGTFGRIEHGYDVRPDLCAVDNAHSPREYVAKTDAGGQVTPARFWVDSLVHDADALRQLIKLFGASRVALGSDYPFPLGEAAPGRLIESMSDLSPQLREQLLYRSVAEFLRIDPSRYEVSEPRARVRGSSTPP